MMRGNKRATIACVLPDMCDDDIELAKSHKPRDYGEKKKQKTLYTPNGNGGALVADNRKRGIVCKRDKGAAGGKNQPSKSDVIFRFKRWWIYVLLYDKFDIFVALVRVPAYNIGNGSLKLRFCPQSIFSAVKSRRRRRRRRICEWWKGHRNGKEKKKQKSRSEVAKNET